MDSTRSRSLRCVRFDAANKTAVLKSSDGGENALKCEFPGAFVRDPTDKDLLDDWYVVERRALLIEGDRLMVRGRRIKARVPSGKALESLLRPMNLDKDTFQLVKSSGLVACMENSDVLGESLRSMLVEAYCGLFCHHASKMVKLETFLRGHLGLSNWKEHYLSRAVFSLPDAMFSRGRSQRDMKEVIESNDHVLLNILKRHEYAEEGCHKHFVWKGVPLNSVKELSERLNVCELTKSCLEVLHDLISSEESGNTYTVRALLKNASSEVLVRLTDLEHVVVEGDKVFMKVTRDNERFIARTLSRINQSVNPRNIGEDNFYLCCPYDPFMEEEKSMRVERNFKKVFRTVTTRRFSIVTGFPGTGKSTLLTRLVVDLGRDMNVTVLAPTGKAVNRLKNELEGSVECMTIESFLRNRRRRTGFVSNGRESLMLVDEFSMVNVESFANLLRSFAKQTARIVLFGDSEQLPAIGPGKLLYDMIESGTFTDSHIHLTDIIRTDGTSLLEALCLIREKRVPSTMIDENGTTGIVVMNTFLNSERVKRTVSEALETVGGDPSKLLVLSILNTTGKQYLYEVQEILNPGRVSERNYKKIDFYVNDRVMQTRNDRHKNLYNGALGTLVKKEDHTFRVKFDSGADHVYTRADFMEDIEHASILSVHKSQGSDAEVVILLMERFVSRLHHRQLVYTAVSRAKKTCIVLGDACTFGKSILKDPPERLTDLARILSSDRILSEEENAEEALYVESDSDEEEDLDDEHFYPGAGRVPIERRVYLEIKHCEKEEAKKRYGVLWDSEKSARCWYIDAKNPRIDKCIETFGTKDRKVPFLFIDEEKVPFDIEEFRSRGKKRKKPSSDMTYYLRPGL